MTWILHKTPLKPIRWHYPEDDHVIDGDSYEDLVKKVKDFRFYRNVPAGNVEQDVAAFICGKFPWAGWKAGESIENPVTPALGALWMRLRKMGESSVARAIAPVVKHRAGICLGCPHNIPIPEMSEEDKVQYRRAVGLICGRLIEGESELGLCSFHLHDNRVASMVNGNEPLRDGQPDHCWVAKDEKGKSYF